MSGTTRLDAFVALSAELTCFEPFELIGTGVAADHLAAADRVVGGSHIDDLLAAHQAICGLTGLARTAAFRRDILGCERLGPIARNVIKLWYVGVWFALPESWQQQFGPAPADKTFVVSPMTYIEGLLWKAAGAHPPGGRAPGFGSWADPPNIPPY